MRKLKHNNLNNFVGACTEAPNICCIWEYCVKGSLQDMIYNDSIALDDIFKFSICIDILRVCHLSIFKNFGILPVSFKSRWEWFYLINFDLTRIPIRDQHIFNIVQHPCSQVNELFCMFFMLIMLLLMMMIINAHQQNTVQNTKEIML